MSESRRAVEYQPGRWVQIGPGSGEWCHGHYHQSEAEAVACKGPFAPAEPDADREVSS